MSDLIEELERAFHSNHNDVYQRDLFKRSRDELERLTAENERRKLIMCPLNAGYMHRWNGDGQCLDCTAYATDLIDAALADTAQEVTGE